MSALPPKADIGRPAMAASRLHRHVSAMKVGALKAQEPIMQTAKTIGLDIAKSLFQVHGVDAAGRDTVSTQ
jgi:hypothetical protein